LRWAASIKERLNNAWLASGSSPEQSFCQPTSGRRLTLEDNDYEKLLRKAKTI
jgi:hypothetical protein